MDSGREVEMLFQVTFSLVLYNTPKHYLDDILKMVDAVDLRKKLYLVDNSPVQNANLISASWIEYIFTGANLGYGSGHNVAMKEASECSECHFVINPDIVFTPETIEEIHCAISSDTSQGLIMPKVLYPDGTIQRLCKILPTPLIMFGRRFVPIKSLKKMLNKKYELNNYDYTYSLEAPFLSGCFMAINPLVFRQVGYFDEDFFMYCEDLDYSRRIHKHFKTTCLPTVSILHNHEKASYSNLKMLLAHIRSSIHYFNKWGWFIDKERSTENRKTLTQIRQPGYYSNKGTKETEHNG